MLKRYRLYCAAIGGILVAFATGLHAQDHREHQPETAQTAQAEPKAAPSPPLPITVTGPVRVEREKEPETDWDKLKCGEAKSHEEADLCEQRRMAKAAESTVQLNWVQIIVGAAGFLALLYSLALNRKATNFAGTSAELNREAVAAALRAAKAAEAAVLSDRPWLINRQVNFGSASDGKGGLAGWNFIIVWRNTGRSPAIGCTTALEPVLIDKDADVEAFRFDGPPKMHRNSNVGADGDIQMMSPSVLMADLEKVFSKTKRLMLYARVEYFVPSQAKAKHTEVCFEAQINGTLFRTKYDAAPSNVFTIVVAGTQHSAS